MVEQRATAPDDLSELFGALSDPVRRDMVARLAESDATVTQLARPYSISLQAVSKHIAVLERAGLVSRSREAQRRPVHLEAQVLDQMTVWVERYRRRAEQRYQRLDAVLAQMDARDEGDQRLDDTTHPHNENHHEGD